MKKILLGGTAIAGMALSMVATPAEALDLSLGGKFSAYGIFANQDDSAGQPGNGLARFDLQRDTEIYFQGESTLDNGLTVGVEVQLNAGGVSNAPAGAPAQGGNDRIDEAYLYFSGNWGRVNVGSENSAAYLLQVGAPSVDPNWDGIEPQYSVYAAGGNAASGREDYGMSMGGTGDRGDTEKFTYLSPVFSGFQVGVSYSPSVCEGAVDCTFPRGGMPANKGAGNFALKDEWSLGGRYAGEFEGVGITAGAGYARATLNDRNNALNTVGDDNRKQWNAGLNLSTAGFTVGGAYFRDNNATNNDGDTRTWTLGGTYATGPYTVGASYLRSKTEVGVNAEDKLSRWGVSGAYTFGPGMTFNGGVYRYRLTDDLSAAADENKATVVTVGTSLQF